MCRVQLAATFHPGRRASQQTTIRGQAHRALDLLAKLLRAHLVDPVAAPAAKLIYCRRRPATQLHRLPAAVVVASRVVAILRWCPRHRRRPTRHRRIRWQRPARLVRAAIAPVRRSGGVPARQRRVAPHRVQTVDRHRLQRHLRAVRVAPAPLVAQARVRGVGRRPSRHQHEVVQIVRPIWVLHPIFPARSEVPHLRRRPAQQTRGAVGCAARRRPQRTDLPPRRRSPLLPCQRVQGRANRGRPCLQPARQGRLEGGTG